MDERAYDLLTPAERTCLRLAGRRLQSKEIAVALDRSPSTVDNHITSALRKLGMSRRAAAGEALLMFEARQESPSQPLIIPAPTMPVDQDGAGAPDASHSPSLVREDRATFEGFDTGEIGSSPEHLTAWLRGLGLVGRLTLVFGTAVLMLLIVLAAPIFAERLGRLGEAIYARR